LVTYLGLKSDHKTAVFAISSGTFVSGAKCLPSAAKCNLVELAPGESALLTRRAGATHLKRYRLKVLSVTLHKLSTTAKAKAAGNGAVTLDLSGGAAVRG